MSLDFYLIVGVAAIAAGVIAAGPVVATAMALRSLSQTAQAAVNAAKLARSIRSAR